MDKFPYFASTQNRSQMKIKKLALSDCERRQLTSGFRSGETHCFRMRCRAILLKAEGLSAAQVGEQTDMTVQIVGNWVKRFVTQERNFSVLLHLWKDGGNDVLLPQPNSRIRFSHR